jgi:hypothetical protein
MNSGEEITFEEETPPRDYPTPQEYDEESRLFYEITVAPDPPSDQELLDLHLDHWVSLSGGFFALAFILAVAGWLHEACFAVLFAASLAARARYIYSVRLVPLLGRKPLTPHEKIEEIFTQVAALAKVDGIVRSYIPSYQNPKTFKITTFSQVKLPDGRISNLRRSATFYL